MSLYRDFDLMDIDANGVWTNENDPTAINIALRNAESAPAFSLAIPARIPDLSPGVASDSTFYIDVEPGGKPNQPPDAATDPLTTKAPSHPSELRAAQPQPDLLDPAVARPAAPPASSQSLRPDPARPVRRRADPEPAARPGRRAWPSLGVLGYFGVFSAWTGSSSGRRTAALRRSRKATLRITVTERGNLESCVTVDGICEVNAKQIKIISLVPEGTKVKKGDIVCKFDSSEIDKNIAQQDIKVKQAVSKIETTAARAGNPAQQGRKRHHRRQGRDDAGQARPGEVPERRLSRRDDQAEGRDRLKEKDLEEAKNKLDQYQAAHEERASSRQSRCAFRKPPSPRPSSSTKAAMLELKVKEKYEYKRKTTEFSVKADQAQKKIEQAVATLKAQMSKATSEYESAQGHRRHRAAAVQGVPQAERQDRHPRRAGRRSSPMPTTPGTTPAARSAKARPSTRSRRSSACPT